MSSRRTITVGAVSATVTLAVLAGVAWAWWIPNAVRERFAEAAARRGLTAEVATVGVSFTDVTLEGIHITGRRALSVDVETLGTGVGLLALSSDGAAAIRNLRVDGVHVSVDLDDPGLPRVLADLRGSGAEGPATASARTIVLEGVAIAARDRDGTLIRADGGRAVVSPEGVVRAWLGPAELAMGEDDGLRLESTEVRLRHAEERGWQIEAGTAHGVAIHYRERSGEERSPLWERLRRHASSVTRALSTEAAPPDPVAREDASDDESAGTRVVRVLEALGPRIAAGADLRLEDLSVTARGEEGRERPVLRELEAQLGRLPNDRYRFEGSGRPARGGRLGWDLTVEPERLLAVGNVNFQRLPFVLLVPFLPGLPWHRPEDARVSGELTIRGEGAARVHLEGNGQLEDLALSSPRIAPGPVQRIGLSLSGSADWIPLERRLEIEGAEIGVGEARAVVSGSLEWPEDHYLVDLRATLPPTDCNTAVAAIPADLLAETAAFTFTGRIGGQVVTRIDSRDLEATVLDIRIANGCVFTTAPGTADVERFRGPFVHRVVEPDGTTFEMESGPGSESWTPITRISPFLVQAVLGHEDSGFFRHSGFSVPSIRLALIRNLTEGRYVYGASTITMQLVKNVFLHREKTLARKVQEVLLTWWIESVMAKDQILELYLNVIEYGPQIYGIRAAAQHYFGRLPSELGPAESAYLASILPNPKGFHSHWESDALPDRFRRRVERFLHTLGSRGRFDQAAVEQGLEQLEHFEFHRVGEPLPPEPEQRGHAAPLPITTEDALDSAWEDELGPDDPDADDDRGEGAFDEGDF